MIEINLLPGRKKAAGAGRRLALPDFKALLANVKDPWLIGAIVAWVVVGGGSAALYVTGRARLSVADARLEAVKNEKRRFDAVIATKRQQEKIRDSLVAELDIIRRIDSDRYIWPHLLDQVTKALPPYTWLTNVAAVSAVTAAGPGRGAPTVATDSTGAPIVRVGIDGRTVDVQAYTTFLRQLAASPWLTDVTPSTSSTVIDMDRPVTQFSITAQYRVADSVYIHTVPLIQSVR